MIARGSVPRTLCKATTRSHNKFRGCVYDVCPTKSPEVRTMISSLCGPESWKPTPCWFPLDSRVLSCARHMSTGPNTLFTTLRLQSLGSKGMPRPRKVIRTLPVSVGFNPPPMTSLNEITHKQSPNAQFLWVQETPSFPSLGCVIALAKVPDLFSLDLYKSSCSMFL